MDSPLRVGDVIETLYWSDADSGTANGVCFRYANKDAAETGPIGSWGGAKCEEERKTGYQAKSDMIAVTRGKRVVVSDIHGFDRYYRQLVQFYVDGEDLGALAIDEGILHNWPFFRGRALKPRAFPY